MLAWTSEKSGEIGEVGKARIPVSKNEDARANSSREAHNLDVLPMFSRTQLTCIKNSMIRCNTRNIYRWKSKP